MFELGKFNACPSEHSVFSYKLIPLISDGALVCVESFAKTIIVYKCLLWFDNGHVGVSNLF